MRIIVMFDLPTKTKAEKKTYTDFRRFLLHDGFDMLQYSVYTRICPRQDVLEKHLKRLAHQAPKKGSVRIMTVTNKQYTDMRILVGEKTSQERTISHENLTLF